MGYVLKFPIRYPATSVAPEPLSWCFLVTGTARLIFNVAKLAHVLHLPHRNGYGRAVFPLQLLVNVSGRDNFTIVEFRCICTKFLDIALDSGDLREGEANSAWRRQCCLRSQVNMA